MPKLIRDLLDPNAVQASSVEERAHEYRCAASLMKNNDGTPLYFAIMRGEERIGEVWEEADAKLIVSALNKT